MTNELAPKLNLLLDKDNPFTNISFSCLLFCGFVWPCCQDENVPYNLTVVFGAVVTATHQHGSNKSATTAFFLPNLSHNFCHYLLLLFLQQKIITLLPTLIFCNGIANCTHAGNKKVSSIAWFTTFKKLNFCILLIYDRYIFLSETTKQIYINMLFIKTKRLELYANKIVRAFEYFLVMPVKKHFTCFISKICKCWW